MAAMWFAMVFDFQALYGARSLRCGIPLGFGFGTFWNGFSGLLGGKAVHQLPPLGLQGSKIEVDRLIPACSIALVKADVGLGAGNGDAVVDGLHGSQPVFVPDI